MLSLVFLVSCVLLLLFGIGVVGICICILYSLDVYVISCIVSSSYICLLYYICYVGIVFHTVLLLVLLLLLVVAVSHNMVG